MRTLRLPLLMQLLLALVAGSALALAFPPFGWVWLAPLAPAALTALCLGVRPRRGAVVGLVFGLAFFGLLLKWVALTGIDGWIAAVVVESLFLAGFGALVPLLGRTRWWPLWVSALWVAVTYARSHIPLGGLPWGRVVDALAGTPMAALASLGGVSFVTFVAVLAGHLVLWAVVVRQRGWVRRVVSVAGAAALALAGLLVPLPSITDRTAAGSATVAIVQGNVPGMGVDFLGRARAVTKNHLEATTELMRDVEAGREPRPDFVLWPENSTDIDPFRDAETRAVIEKAVGLAEVPILVGAVLDGPGPTHRQTASIVWDPETGPGEVYAKRHPVPFGEYIPFRELLLPLIDRLQMVGRDTYPGDEPGRMRIAGTEIGVVICFEIAYNELVADVARDGAEILVVPSNNATWQGLGMAEQQFAITRMRAIEYGKATLVATPSGISGVVGPDGEVVEKSVESTQQVFVNEIPKRTTRTPAAVMGAGVELGLVIVGGSAVVVAAWTQRRRRGREA